MQKTITFRRQAINSFLFSLKWYIKHRICFNDVLAKWYWNALKQDAYYLWKWRNNTNKVTLREPNLDEIDY